MEIALAPVHENQKYLFGNALEQAESSRRTSIINVD